MGVLAYTLRSTVAHPEETNDARFKKVRKAEYMGTTKTKPLAVPEKKMRRADTTPLAENEIDPRTEMAATSRPPEYGSMRKRNK